MIHISIIPIEEVLKCLVCNETEAGCNENGDDAKIVDCQISNPDGDNYGNACLVGHTGMPYSSL